MDHSITILSEKEKAILESYMLSADGLAEFWGENCEVIIHDLTPAGCFCCQNCEWASFRQTGRCAHFRGYTEFCQ